MKLTEIPVEGYEQIVRCDGSGTRLNRLYRRP